MQIVANHQLIRNRGRAGGVLYVVAMLVLVAGYVRSLQVRDNPADFAPDAWLSITLGVVLWAVAMAQINRWGPKKRAEGVLARAIRSLDDRYKLYAFISSRLPDYILASPAGVHVIVVRSQGGQVICEGNRWRRQGASAFLAFFGNALGNPSADAARQAQRIRTLLAAEGMQDVPVGALIVFTHPGVQLRVQCQGATVTRLSELRHVVQRAAGKGRDVALNASRLREVQAVFDQRLERASAWR